MDEPIRTVGIRLELSEFEQLREYAKAQKRAPSNLAGFIVSDWLRTQPPDRSASADPPGND